MAVIYCLACGAENSGMSALCRGCGRALSAGVRERMRGVAFLLNEIQALRTQGDISEDVYLRLRQRYVGELGMGMPSARVAPAGEPRSAARQQREGPGWLVEQQANLLLYLGAFLIVIATVIYVGYSEQGISDNARMALLVLGTLFFLAVGLVCLRFPRVQQAGIVFFAVGALMVPLDFVGAYAFFLSDHDIDPVGLWLAGSMASVLFYGAVSLLGLGRWYAVPAVVGAGSALAAVLALASAPPEAYPGSFVAFAFLCASPSSLPLRRVSDVFGQVGAWAAHGAVPLALIAALWIAAASATDRGGDVVLATRWFLPPTVALAALFYAVQAWLRHRLRSKSEPALTIAALGVGGGAAVAMVFALHVGQQWYGPAVAIVGGLYAAGSEGLGPRWFGQRYLGWLALGAITASWLIFEGLYDDFPRQGAGVHFAASAFYLAAARLVKTRIALFATSASSGQPQARRDEYTVPAAVGFVYAAGLTFGIAFFYLLASLRAPDAAEASDVVWPFFGVSLALASMAASLRWWWPEVRLHAYLMTLAMSLFVLLASVDDEGQVALLLAVYTVVALALSLAEREPVALTFPATYGFFALLAAWRYFEPDDAYLPLVCSGVGYGLFAAYLLLRIGRVPMLRPFPETWPIVAQVLAYAYAIAAPIVAWVRLGVVADPDGFVGAERFEETLLYQTAAASVLLLGLLLLAQSWLLRRLQVAAGASAVLMVALLLEIGHLRPGNVQAYTAPLGVYLLLGALLSLRVAELPQELRSFVGPLEVLGAAVLMGPTLGQSWGDGAWRYGLILLGEGLGLLALALVQRRLWLLGASVTFVVLDGLHYLFFAGGPAIPSWAILAIAGAAVMAAGTAILLGRDRWIVWQRSLQGWWRREAPTVSAT